MRYLAAAASALLFVGVSLAASDVNFPYEEDVLTDADVAGNSKLRFGDDGYSDEGSKPKCKAFPDTDSWPSELEWRRFNQSLGGALIQTIPPAWPCHNSVFGKYDEAKCNSIKARYSNTTFAMEDPGAIMTPWPSGDTCPPDPNKPCTLAGFPSYVVNVTKVKHVQLAVNFARNNNIRLVIKNTGHEFNGKSTGAGSLSVWVHHLKAFEYLPKYASPGSYIGRAARVGVALQAFEQWDLMVKYNITMATAGGSTVGTYGGYAQGGGHGVMAPALGLGADQFLSLKVVTADGRFVTADPRRNSDLFWAISGGGASTFGIVTSAIVKAYPAFPVTSWVVSTNSGLPVSTISNDALWKAFYAFCSYKLRLADVKAFSLWVLRSPGSAGGPFGKRADSKSYSLFLDIVIPYMNTAQASAFLKPLTDQFEALGLTGGFTTSDSFGADNMARVHQSGVGDGTGNARHASRLFPRENFVPGTKLFNDTFQAIKNVIDAQYAIIGDGVAATAEVAGNPDNAVNPAWRKAVLHATAVDSLPANYTVADLAARHARLDALVQPWRDLSPGAGAYLNEGDVQEPNWQQSFYGTNYPRLLKIKRKYDPYELFYMPTGVGSEGWEVRAPGGAPTQNGRLCRV